MVLREDVLAEAANIIVHGREETHGRPENTFASIARFWTVYLDRAISPQEVAMMMVLLKVARQQQNDGHVDNYVDGAGYLGLAAELATRGDE